MGNFDITGLEECTRLIVATDEERRQDDCWRIIVIRRSAWKSRMRVQWVVGKGGLANYTEVVACHIVGGL